MEYDKINVTDSDKVPFDAPIGVLTWTTGRYYVSGHAIDEDTQARLAERGVEVVGDLDGWSRDDLMEIKGIGPASADGLIEAAEKASVDYRGTGFPWDVTVKVRVPREKVDDLSGLGENTVEDILADLIQERGLLDEIQERAKERQALRIRQDIQELKAELSELEA